MGGVIVLEVRAIMSWRGVSLAGRLRRVISSVGVRRGCFFRFLSGVGDSLVQGVAR